jgi:phospholipase/carboxylesterase
VKLGVAIAGAVALAATPCGSIGARPAPSLKARPTATSGTLPVGETQLADGATAYSPASAPAGPLPLLILLHGAGGYPPRFLQTMEPVADRLGVILLAPHSRGTTWDLVQNMAIGEDPWSGSDGRRIDQLLADLFARAAVDPSHVVLLGFSDGASYALSLGVANPKLFTAIIALSPGMLAPPPRVDPAQRIFIAHGRGDHVLSFAASSDIADALRRQRANLRFRPFEGDHQIDAASLTEALEWTLDGSPRGLQR